MLLSMMHVFYLLEVGYLLLVAVKEEFLEEEVAIIIKGALSIK